MKNVQQVLPLPRPGLESLLQMPQSTVDVLLANLGSTAVHPTMSLSANGYGNPGYPSDFAINIFVGRFGPIL